MIDVLKHHSIDFYEHADWWEATCNCGANLGVFPDAETAADALMQHAYEEGLAAASALLPCGHRVTDLTSADHMTFCAVCAVSNPAKRPE